MSGPFLRTKVTLVVLSDRPVDDLDLGKIAYECDQGDMLLASIDSEVEALDREAMNAATLAAGSDPSFWTDD